MTNDLSDASLRRALMKLPPRTRMALILLREDDLTYEQIGARLHITPSEARRLVERGMEFLLESTQDVPHKMSNKRPLERLERERIRRECLFLADHAGKMASLVRRHRERLEAWPWWRWFWESFR